MKAVIEQGMIRGAVTAPPSKSMTQRAYAAALLHHGTTTIYNAGSSNDELAALRVIQQLGAGIVTQTDSTITIQSKGVNPIADIIDCGESGLGARLFTPIAALSDKALTITGGGTLLSRPMEGFAHVLGALGVQLTNFNGYLPARIQGPLKARALKVDGSGGSQLLSGLLFAIAYAATEPVTITVSALKSKPYIDMTLDMLAQAGRPVKQLFYQRFIIDPALFAQPQELELNVEGDWSGAAFMLVAGAIAGNVTVHNLNTASKQADRAILDVLRSVDAQLTIAGNSVTVQAAPLQPFEFDATDCPDLFPILAILAACCDGESSIRGLHRLFHKESNRVESVTEMLFDFAIPFSAEDDILYITGVHHLQGTVIDSYHDHRIAMAAAIGALRARGPVDITHCEVVNKSYPAFFRDVEGIGGKVGIVEE